METTEKCRVPTNICQWVSECGSDGKLLCWTNEIHPIPSVSAAMQTLHFMYARRIPFPTICYALKFFFALCRMWFFLLNWHESWSTVREWHTKTLAHRINGWPNATKVITKCHTNSEVKYREKMSSTAKYLHIWFPFWFGFFFIAAAILVSLICVNGIRIHFDGSKNIGKLVPNRVLWRYLFRTQSSIRRIQNQIELLKCSMRLCEILLYFFFNFPWVFE